MLEALGTQLGVPSTRVNSYTVNPDAVGCLREGGSKAHGVPVAEGRLDLVVAIASPKDKLAAAPRRVDAVSDVGPIPRVDQPSGGRFLVTGPTGSGKTSTLYASLAEISEKGRNVITIEDPVEYWLPGVNQGQTNHKSGFTFARGMRAILRQDPDVIMVGEIRDSETLETAIEAALTGHLVLSTLHTNSSIATVTRLAEMGLEPYLLASAVTGILAQRLVRKICERCKEPIPTPRALRHLFQEGVPDKVYRGMGCDDCRGTGFLGRHDIFELLVLTDELRGLMHDRASGVELTEVARRTGFISLRDACLARVADGTTTLEEVIRVTMAGRDDDGDNAAGPALPSG